MATRPIAASPRGATGPRASRRSAADRRARTRPPFLFSLLAGLVLLTPSAAAADTSVETNANASTSSIHGAWGPVWTSTTTGYIVYVNAGEDLQYRKTTNGGASWASAVTVSVGDDLVEKLAVWYDNWTTGDAGTVIHMAYVEASADIILYRSLDTATDTLGTERTILDVAAVDTSDANTALTLTKARGGNLYAAFYYDNTGAEDFFYRSTDGGTTWTARATNWDTDAVAWIRSFPGNEAATNNVWLVHWDRDADAIELKVYDNGANSWSTTTIATGMVDSTSLLQMSGAQRQSDNHVILAAWNATFAGTPDLNVFDIGSTSSIVRRSDVVTDTDTGTNVGLHTTAFIDQRTNDLYVAYLNGALSPSFALALKYKRSTDGGATWGAAVQVNENANAGTFWADAGMSVSSRGGRMHPLWVETGAADLFVASPAKSVYLGPAVTLGLTGAPQAENGGVATVTATLGAAASLDTTVSLGFAGTATPTTDYVRSGTSIVVSAGSTTGSITITGVDDPTDEPGETVLVEITGVTNGYESGTQQVVSTISDDDPQPAASVNDASAAEGEGVGFTITLSNPSSSQIDIDYTTSSGTATEPLDFPDATGTVVFAPGETSKPVPASTTEDLIDEPDESFTVTISLAAGETDATLADATGTGTISDDDATPAASVNDASASEGDAVTFTVTLSNPSSSQVDIAYTTTTGTATESVDFPDATGQITFAPLETLQTISVPTTEDPTDEPNEGFTVTIVLAAGETDAAIGDGTGAGTIADDDATPAASVNDAAAPEGDAVGFTVTLTNPSSSQVDIAYTTLGGTATEGADFADATGTLVFAPGETSKPIPVTTTEDATDEPAEGFTVTIGLAAGESDATVGDATGTGTVTDDDPAPAASVNDANAAEGDGIGFTVTLSNPSSTQVDIDYATTSGTAMEATDFSDATGTLVFAPGETSKPIPVTTTEDAADEPAEGFSVTISLAAGEADATIDDATGAGTINDDDPTPAASVDDAAASEGDSIGFTVTLSNPSSNQIDIDYTTSDGTATEGTDFPDATGQVSFAPGETSKPVTVPTTEDGGAEPGETFTITIALAAGEVDATLLNATGTGTINNDDAAAGAGGGAGGSGIHPLATVGLLELDPSSATVPVLGRLHVTAWGVNSLNERVNLSAGTCTWDALEAGGTVHPRPGQSCATDYVADVVPGTGRTLRAVFHRPDGSSAAASLSISIVPIAGTASPSGSAGGLECTAEIPPVLAGTNVPVTMPPGCPSESLVVRWGEDVTGPLMLTARRLDEPPPSTSPLPEGHHSVLGFELSVSQESGAGPEPVVAHVRILVDDAAARSACTRTPCTVVLLHAEGDAWEGLDLAPLGKEGASRLYEATITSFSFFMVVAHDAAPVAATPAPAPSEPGSASGLASQLLMAGGVWAVAMIGLVALLWIGRRPRQGGDPLRPAVPEPRMGPPSPAPAHAEAASGSAAPPPTSGPSTPSARERALLWGDLNAEMDVKASRREVGEPKEKVGRK